MLWGLVRSTTNPLERSVQEVIRRSSSGFYCAKRHHLYQHQHPGEKKRHPKWCAALIITCMCRPLSSRCRCYTWHSSTTGTCSYTATHANTDVCCSPAHSTSGHSCWSGAWGSCCRLARASLRCLSQGPARSNSATSQCTLGPCPWACGKRMASWSLRRWDACCGWLWLVPHVLPAGTCPSGCSPAHGTSAESSSTFWWCRNLTLRDTYTPDACYARGPVQNKNMEPIRYIKQKIITFIHMAAETISPETSKGIHHHV